MDLKRQLLEYYKAERQLEKDRKKLISAKGDYRLLEKIIMYCNENPNLRVTVQTKDGTKLELMTYQERKPLLFGEQIMGIGVE